MEKRPRTKSPTHHRKRPESPSVFPAHPTAAPEQAAGHSATQGAEERIGSLREELHAARSDLERSTEALDEARKEISAMRELYQTTNEELETSYEELHVTNEELNNANQELELRLGELEETNDTFRNLLASTDVAAIFLDTDLRVRWSSPAARKLIPVTPSDTGRPLSDLKEKYTDPDLLADAAVILDRPGPVAREVWTGDRWFTRRVLPYRTEGDRVDGVVITFDEITEVKQTQQRLETAYKELEQHHSQLRGLALELTRAEENERRRIAGVLHDDLQQILAGARFCLNRARREGSGDSKYLGKLGQLIDTAIATARSLSHELSPAILQEGLLPALDWATRWFREKHGLELNLHTDPFGEPARTEVRDMLFTSARELLFNIVKHAGVREAEVRLDRIDGAVRLTVADKGKGVDSPADRPTEGMKPGFGLLTIRERIGALGGQVEIDSRPGDGTRVALTLPDLQPEEEETAPVEETADLRAPAETPTTGGDLRILLVDDHNVMRDGLRMLLEDEPGVEIIGEAADGETALSMAAERHPDIVLMDVNLPGMGGVEATRRIRGRHPRIKVIALSMLDASDGAEAMLRAGATAYVQKTASSETLAGAIRSAAAELFEEMEKN